MYIYIYNLYLPACIDSGCLRRPLVPDTFRVRQAGRASEQTMTSRADVSTLASYLFKFPPCHLLYRTNLPLHRPIPFCGPWFPPERSPRRFGKHNRLSFSRQLSRFRSRCPSLGFPEERPARRAFGSAHSLPEPLIEGSSAGVVGFEEASRSFEALFHPYDTCGSFTADMDCRCFCPGFTRSSCTE